MATIKKKWYQRKTTWTGIAAIVGAGVGMTTGAIDIKTGVQTIVGGFALIFMRDAIEGIK